MKRAELDHLNQAVNIGGRSITNRQSAHYFHIILFALFFYVIPYTVLTIPVLIYSFGVTVLGISLLFEEKYPKDGYPHDLFIFNIKSSCMILPLTLLATCINIALFTNLTAVFVGAMLLISTLGAALSLYQTISANDRTLQTTILQLFLVTCVAVTGIHFSLLSFYCLNLLCSLQAPATLSLLATPSIHLYSAFSAASAVYIPETQLNPKASDITSKAAALVL